MTAISVERVSKQFPPGPEGGEKTIAVDNVSFKVRSGEPLLNALERKGSGTDALCRSGECGVCRTRLVKGEVFMPPSVSLRKSDAIFGYIHPCAAYPMSDLVIRL